MCTYFAGIVTPTFYMTSIFSLVVLTIDRFIAIVYSLRYPSLMTPQRSKIIVGFAWASCLVISAVSLGAYAPARVSQENSMCIRDEPNIFEVLSVSWSAVSFSIILILYIFILKVARRQARRIAAQNQIGNPQNAPQPINTKSATTVIIITGTVFMCFTPGCFFQIMKVNGIALGQNFEAIAYIIYVSNGWLNCIIYYWRNRELRQTLHNLVSSCCH